MTLYFQKKNYYFVHVFITISKQLYGLIFKNFVTFIKFYDGMSSVCWWRHVITSYMTHLWRNSNFEATAVMCFCILQYKIAIHQLL